MRIDKIEICNLASFEGEHVLDFTVEPLRSVGVFGIVGNVQSTDIIDAICVALYDRAPRYPETSLMVCQNEKMGYSRITFSLRDGATYEALWKIKGENDMAIDRTLCRIYPKRMEYPQVDDAIHTLIGLSYDQFIRMVQLSPKDFDMFLCADEKQKSPMFETLTGMNVYGAISSTIHDHALKAEYECESFKRKIEGIGAAILDSLQLEKLREDQNHCISQIKHDETIIKTIEDQMVWVKEYECEQLELQKIQEYKQEMLRQYNTLHDKKQMLDRYDSVLPFHSMYCRLHQTDAENEALKKEIHECQQSVHNAEAILASVAEACEAAKLQQVELQMKADEMRPKFNQCLAKRGEMEILAAVMEKEHALIGNCQNLIENAEGELARKDMERKRILEQSETLKQHLQTISMHQRMVENYEKVKEKLVRAIELENTSKGLRKDLENDQTNLQVLRVQIENLQKKCEKYEADLKSLSEGLEIHVQANRGFNSAEMQVALNNVTDMHQRACGAYSLWKRIEVGYTYVDDTKATIREEEIRMGELSGEIVDIQEKLSAQNQKLEVLKQSYMLSLSNNIKELRRQLREGNACPVCGAAHHPYHSETELELGQLISELEKNYNSACLETNAMTQLQNQKLVEKAEAEGRLQKMRKNLEDAVKVLDADIAEWKNYEDLDKSFRECSVSVNRMMRSTLLVQMIDRTKRERDLQIETNAQYNNRQDRINTINRKLGYTNEAMRENLVSLSNLMSERRILESRMEANQKRLEGCMHDYTVVLNELDGFVSLPLWNKRWAENHENLIQDLTSLVQDWQNSIRQQEMLAKKLFKQEADMANLTAWLVERRKFKAEAEQRTQQYGQLLESRQNEIRQLVGEGELNQIMAASRSKLTAVLQKVQESQKKYDEALARLTTCRVTLSHLQIQQKAKEQELLKCRSDMDLGISRFNVTHPTLQYFELEKIFSDPRDWNQLRKELEESSDRYNQAKYKENVSIQRISNMQQRSLNPLDETTDTMENLEFRLESCRRHKEKMSGLLRQKDVLMNAHVLAEQQMQEFSPQLSSLQKQAENWQKLDKVLGSMDGSKFRKTAQEIIFELLVKYANFYLDQLSSRYRLQCSDRFLSVDVVDLDMLSRVCPYRVLSEGERFVACLALSLGLASLAGDECCLAGMFVDRGMDTLSGTGLDVAVEALERLHGRDGWKIGVLTNSEQVRQRLHVQTGNVKRPSRS